MNRTSLTRRQWLAGSGALLTGSMLGPDHVFSQTGLDRQSDAGTNEPSSGLPFAPDYTQAKVFQWQMGMKLRTPVTFTNGIATFPIPMDWPEQSVTLSSRDVSGAVTHLQTRDLLGGVRQAVVGIARMTANSSLQVLLNFRIEKRDILAPTQTDSLVIPSRVSRELRIYLGSSPMIDATDRQIRALSQQLATEAQDDTSGWQTVRRIYDRVRSEVTYTEGPIRNASDALKDGKGDCEDMTSLFVALCRNAEIPARMVWIPGHCYPEFYLEEKDGTAESGHWYPCQAAGSDLFGQMQEERPILQKGDRFKIPGERQPVRYVSESFRCDRRGRGEPRVEFVRQQVS